MAKLHKLMVLTAALAAVMGLSALAGTAQAASSNPNVTPNTGVMVNQVNVIPDAASTRFHGACGGGTTFNDMVAGWRAHGVLDDVLRMAGISPSGVDGPPLRLLRKAMVHVRVSVGTMHAANATCTDGRFKGLRKPANQPAGSGIWTLKSWIGKRGEVHTWWADNCGNLRHGNIVTKKPQPKPQPTPTPVVQTPTGNCNVVIINSPGAVGQACITYWVNCGIIQQGPFTTGAAAWQWAVVNCTTTTPQVTSCSTCANAPPPSQCTTCQPVPAPKDSTQTPSGTLPGVPNPAPGPGNGPMCFDANGNWVPGTPDPQTSMCPGVASPSPPNSTSPNPPKPSSGQCIDPGTLQSRPMASDETTDDVGYCIKK